MCLKRDSPPLLILSKTLSIVILLIPTLPTFLTEEPTTCLEQATRTTRVSSRLPTSNTSHCSPGGESVLEIEFFVVI